MPENSGRIATRYRVLQGPAGAYFRAGLTAFASRKLTLPIHDPKITSFASSQKSQKSAPPRDTKI